MNFYLLSDDQIYKEKIYDFYTKMKYQFLKLRITGDIKEDEIVICHESSLKSISNPYLLLSHVNEINHHKINQFQNIVTFFEQLKSYEFHKSEPQALKVFAIFNGAGGSGATTLAINLCKSLSETQKVMFISLEYFSSMKYGLTQDRKYSISDIIYHVKNKSECVSNCFDSSENFNYFNASILNEDLFTISKEFISDIEETLVALEYSVVVLDCSNRIEFLELINVSRTFLTIEHSEKHFIKISGYRDKFLENACVLVNKRRLDSFINDSALSVFKNIHYFDWDYKLEGDHTKWESKIIQKSWKKVIKHY